MEKSLSPVRWILFDAVGTLLVPAPSVATAYQAAGRRHGCHLGLETIATRFREAFTSVFGGHFEATSETGEREKWKRVVAEVFRECSDARELFEELWQHFAEPANWKALPGAVETVAEFIERGYQVGVASNFDKRLRPILLGHGFRVPAQHVFISSEIGYAKPDPRFYASVQQRLACAADAIVMVGDDPVRDYDAPAALGWQAFLLAKSAPSGDRRLLRNLSELLTALA